MKTDCEIIKDSPPANAIDQKEEKFFPIIRCEDFHEILSINLKIDKKEIQLKTLFLRSMCRNRKRKTRKKQL